VLGKHARVVRLHQPALVSRHGKIRSGAWTVRVNTPYTRSADQRYASVAGMADTVASEATGSNPVEVQVLSDALLTCNRTTQYTCNLGVQRQRIGLLSRKVVVRIH
jgi:hypothetical protein